MGYEQRYALVSMTNKDVYYLTKDAAKELMALIGDPAIAFYETTDAKSGSKIMISIANVSSIVTPREGNR